MSACCPICRKEAVAPYSPFCSKRCADVDLGKWLSGAYAVPAVESDEDSFDESQTDAHSIVD